MKKVMCLVSMVCLIPFVAYARDGHDGGNGGRGYVCEDRQDKVEEVRFYDTALFSNYEYLEFESVEEGKDYIVDLLEEALPEYNSSFYGLIEYIHQVAEDARMDYVNNQVYKEVNPKFDLKYYNSASYVCDSGTLPSLRPIASYSDEPNELRVNGLYYEMLSINDRVALILHEGLFKVRRLENNNERAENTMHLTAFMMSHQDRDEQIKRIRASFSFR